MLYRLSMDDRSRAERRDPGEGIEQTCMTCPLPASLTRFALLTLILVALVLPARAIAAPVPGACDDGILPGGALSRICVPAAGWNGDLVVWAHRYIAFNEPLDFYDLTFSDGVYLPDVLQGLGFAFATTSYRANGLVVLAAIDDIQELIAAFPAVAGRSPRRTYMTGASEGGLVTVLAVTRHPELFTGGLAACGPIGSFRRQVDYITDFRILFDYFFPGVLPGSPIDIPPAVIDDWDAVYVPAIASALAANPTAAQELIQTAGAAIDPLDGTTVQRTTIDVLWYNVFGTNDAVSKLGGNPYTNRGRFYRGSSNDFRLNVRVRRVRADVAARARLGDYETSGRLAVPLVTIHTGGDPVVPFWHEQLYSFKVDPIGKGSFLGRPVDRYGHCHFTTRELLSAFTRLVLAAR